MRTVMKDGTEINFTYYGVDDSSGYDIYISDELLPIKFKMHDTMDSVDWKTANLRKELDVYLLNNFDKDFIKILKPDNLGDIISIPAVAELFNSDEIDIFKGLYLLNYKELKINRKLGEIYWLKDLVIDGMFCACCSLGGEDMQVQTNYEYVRARILL